MGKKNENNQGNSPVSAEVRLAVVNWPDDAPRGAVASFCVEQGISRAVFYKIRKQSKEYGAVEALEPRSRRPRSSPRRLNDYVRAQALEVRASLERSGLDHGPISVHDKMVHLGFEAPSVSMLAKLFRQEGVARKEPRKKPRSAWRRFVYPFPNDCWQLDATEYVLAKGRKCVIFQLIDDHSRLAVASLVASSETSNAAIRVFNKAVAVYGVPRYLLTDNGAALNPTRRGFEGKLVNHVSSLGTVAITGKPYKPTTQGKNERFHQTLFKYLNKQPITNGVKELQAQVDAFDMIYNTERGHQALPDRITPLAAYNAKEKAQPPRPKIPKKIIPGDTTETRQPMIITRQLPEPRMAQRQRQAEENGITPRTVRNNGTIRVSKIEYHLGARYAAKLVFMRQHQGMISFFDKDGELIIEHEWPPTPGTTYVGSTKK